MSAERKEHAPAVEERERAEKIETLLNAGDLAEARSLHNMFDKKSSDLWGYCSDQFAVNPISRCGSSGFLGIDVSRKLSWLMC